MTVLALLGSKALYALFVWLLGAIACSYLAGRKGYGEQPGLATGLLLPVLGVIIWLAWPPRPESLWTRVGPFRRAGLDAQRASGGEAGE